MSERLGRSVCSRTDCDREATFVVTDLQVEFSEPDVPGPTSYVAAGDPTPVCAEHLAELIAIARDDVTGIEHWMVTAPDYGLTHVIAEGATGARYA